MPYNILIGPLASPLMLGNYQSHPSIKVFSSQPQQFADPSQVILYDAHCMVDFFQLLERLPGHWQPDVLIWCDLSYQCLPPGIENCPFPTVLVVGDWNVCYATVINYSQVFDRIFTDRRLKGLLHQAGYHKVDWWPCFYYDPQKCYVDPTLTKQYDITFIGNLNAHVHPQRNRYLTRLLKLQDRYRVFIRQGIYDEAYTRVLNQSRIVFNYTICGVANLRVFEAPACGALLFTEAENLEIRDFLQDGQECILYQSDNLEERLDFFLTHEDQRQAIAAKGHAKVANYTYEKQFHVLMGLLAPTIQNFNGSQARRFQRVPTYQKHIMHVKNAYYSLEKEATHTAILAFQQVISKTAEPVIRLKYINALATVLVSNELGKRPPSQCTAILEQARLLLHQALVIDPQHPLLHYHLGFCQAHLGENDVALEHYLIALSGLPTLLWTERQWADWLVMPLGYNRFKMAWERCGFSETTESQPYAYRRILLYQLHCLTGKIYQSQQQFLKALGHYEQALALSAAHGDHDYELMELSEDNGGAAYELSECWQALGKINEAITICQEAVNKHPLWIKARLQLYQLWLQNRQWQDVLDGTQNCLELLKMLDWYDLPEVFNDLQGWARLGWALEQARPVAEIVALLPLTFSDYTYAQTMQLVGSYAPYYPHLYRGLAAPLAVQWSSPWPENYSAETDWQPSATATIEIQWLDHTYVFERNLITPTDLRQRCLGTDCLPLAFIPTPLAAPFELEGTGAVNVLVILSDWQEIPNWMPSFLGLPSLTWILWQPNSEPTENTLIQIETWLEPHPELAVVVLSEPMDAATQLGLLQKVQLVAGSACGHIPFYLAWALWLGVPYLCVGIETLGIQGLPDIPAFHTLDPSTALAKFAVALADYQQSALAGQQQYHHFYLEHRSAMQNQLWWDIRLQLLSEM